jgi:hypothetical protein
LPFWFAGKRNATLSCSRLVEFAVSRDLRHNDGSVARWYGTMLYDADSAVPSTITLNGNVSMTTIRPTAATWR